MIRSDLLRRICLVLTALVFALIAGRAAIAPDRLAHGLGYTLAAPNGYSEIFAVYVGVWLATAWLAIAAARRVKDAWLGDLVALFVLSQPAARAVAALSWGLPTGTLLFMFAVEAVGGALLLLVRPTA
ncbi:MAG TPA: DUF4345 family protein [Ramlibacter sp.]|nr:DUF4345 family protein [Ramlibacter sp.]